MADRSFAPLRASVIINNYNYGRFLRESIESALAQTHPQTEVIVVDDGSTDESRDVIAAYGDRVVPVLKENGGQASAFNAGFRACRGDVVLFLDADDALLPTAVARAVERFGDASVVKVHWPLWQVDGSGTRTGQLVPGPRLPEGDLRALAVREGPGSSAWPPTSGNACARQFLEDVLPVPEEDYRICADAYLFTLAPAAGVLAAVQDAQACYRVHGENNFHALVPDEKVDRAVRVFDLQCRALSGYLRRHGIDSTPEVWQANSFWHGVRDATRTIARTVPEGVAFALVDEDQLGLTDTWQGRRRLHFPDSGGHYGGPPAGDDAALAELTRLRQRGAGFIVFAWTAFWWLDHYRRFRDHLRSNFRCVAEDARVVAFDLRGRES